MKAKVGNYLLLFLSLIVVLVVAEVTLRVTGYDWTHGYVRAPIVKGKGTIYADEWTTTFQIVTPGLRQDAPLTPHQPGEIRILMVGDSFTFGAGVHGEDAYPQVVEDQLLKTHPTVSVLNAGGHGGFAGTYERYLREHWNVLSPDWLLLQIYLGNDFYEALDFPPPLRVMTAGMNWPEVKEAIKSIRVVRFLWDTVGLPFTWNVLAKNAKVRDWLYGAGLRLVPESILFVDYYPGEQAMADEMFGYISNVHELAQSHNVPMVLLVIPFREQLTYYRDRVDDSLDYRRPNRLIREFANEKGLPVIDLLEDYDPLPNEQIAQLFYHRDLHWNVDGHRRAGLIIADWFEENFKGKVQIPH